MTTATDTLPTPRSSAAKTSVDQTREHYVIADALGHARDGITVRRLVQTREEAVAYLARRKHMQAWRDSGGSYVWSVGDRLRPDSAWRTELRGG